MASTTLSLTAYHNCDDVQLYWKASNDKEKNIAIDDCVGFAIYRRRKGKDGQWGPDEILRNRVGFKDDTEAEAEKEDSTKPSDIWPFQSYSWTDHGANSNQVVCYQVHAMSLPDGATIGEDKLSIIFSSGWSAAIQVDAACDNNFSAFFNRGFVMSQFVSRMIRENNWKTRDIKNNVKVIEEPLRRFMSGELRKGVLALLDSVIEDPQLELYAALYELDDEELIRQLTLLNKRAHIVLSNGSGKSKDGNEKSRATLHDAGVDVYDRLLGSKGLGHNKFAVVYNKKTKKARKVWTGSMNWSSSGMCTQVNNAVLIEDENIAQSYFDHWHQLADAGNDFTAELITGNATFDQAQEGQNPQVWFTPVRKHSTKNTTNGIDLLALSDAVKQAKEMVLYVMFQPGNEPLQSIMGLPESVIVKGVVSTLNPSLEEAFELNGPGMDNKRYGGRLVIPDGIHASFSAWLQEITRDEFLYPNLNPGIGHAITHSKMIVIDPLSDDCTVITGSHNFSASASEKNDENFIIVKGNKALAEAYAVACLGTYAHYRWRAYVADKQAKNLPVWSHLNTKPSWQKDCLTKEVKNTLNYWCR